MATTDKLFAGSIPELYERFLVPLIFESYARDLAKRVAGAAPKDVLETAAGTGVLTRAMTARLPAAARIVATDLNQSMLDQAAKRQDGDRRIERRPADALALPFPAASFDVVVPIRHDFLSRQNRGVQGSAAGSAIRRPSDLQRMGPDLRKRNSPILSSKPWRRSFP